MTAVGDRHDGYDEYDTIYAHLRKLFDLSGVSQEQQILLGALSFACRRGLGVEEIKKNIEYAPKDLIRLCSLGYIIKSESTPPMYSLHPLMSELAIKDFVKDPAPFEKVINYIVYEKSQMSGNDTVDDLEMRFDYAEHIYKRLLQLSVSYSSVTRALLVSCNSLGDIVQAQGDLKNAEKYYKQSYELAEQIVKEIGTIDLRNNFAVSCERLGVLAFIRSDFMAALRFYKQCYDIREQLVNETGTITFRRNMAASCEQLGHIAQVKGDLVSAELYYKQGYNMRERIDEEIGTVDSKGGLAYCCCLLGEIALIKDDYETAKYYFKQGYEISKYLVGEMGVLSMRGILAVSCNAIGNIAIIEDEMYTAELYCKKGYDLTQHLVEQHGVGAWDAFIGACVNMYFIIDDEGSSPSMLLKAFDMAQGLYDKGMDVNGRYKLVLNELEEHYHENGDEENAQKMRDVLATLE